MVLEKISSHKVVTSCLSWNSKPISASCCVMSPHLPVREGLQKAQRLCLCQVKVEVVCTVVCRIEKRLKHLLLQRNDGVVDCNPHLRACVKHLHAGTSTWAQLARRLPLTKRALCLIACSHAKKVSREVTYGAGLTHMQRLPNVCGHAGSAKHSCAESADLGRPSEICALVWPRLSPPGTCLQGEMADSGPRRGPVGVIEQEHLRRVLTSCNSHVLPHDNSGRDKPATVKVSTSPVSHALLSIGQA